MATHRIPIHNGLLPQSTGGNAFFEPYSVKASNDQWGPMVAVFNSSTAREPMHGTFDVPQNYASGATAKVAWTSTGTTGSVVWDFDYRAVGGDDTESLDQAGTQEATSVTDAAPSTAHGRMIASSTLTDGNFASGDTVEFLLARDGSDASDDMGAAALVFGAYFEYSDT